MSIGVRRTVARVEAMELSLELTLEGRRRRFGADNFDQLARLDARNLTRVVDLAPLDLPLGGELLVRLELAASALTIETSS